MIPQLERQHPLATARGSWPHWTLRSATGNTLIPNSEPEFEICNHCHPLFSSAYQEVQFISQASPGIVF
ncbi:hypothetical protein PFLUV_G00018530 [Perca fluviatilis]|uniref:Uncharacterized protein n=1 Tax=Perca fluviatilis TaxID=8168 RepID=A0A6A5FLN4_PERFL|nr:hypothetical protein PFLUV_G00018530 [Perca fluviatilis]